MRSMVRKALVTMTVCVGLTVASIPAFAAKAVNLTASLAEKCSNCDTDVSPVGTTGDFSLLSDGSSYAPGNGVQSQILTNNTVYTLSTMNTLVNGLVGPGARTVEMHFYSPVEGIYANNVLPACWQGAHDQDQAVNWSIFSSSVGFPSMQVGQSYGGFSRLDFNVRNGVCDGQVYRFFLKYYNVCITRTSLSTWDITSDSCGKASNYGEAGLNGQGGKGGQTIYYGDWRVPFKVTLTK
ncbi:MAG: hypothetical protein ACE145_19265 [Terriglobia bacterium]